MSYLVLARKWRPQKFDDVIGQPHVARTLQNAVTSGRIAHAYLFTGARGVGKTSVARILAKALNCERGASAHPCNECSNCREITQGNAMDVLEIDGASNRGIDNIRELRETVRYRPAKGHYKIYIIDEVHMLTSEAFNALLKTLEEPPERVVFIFATTEPHKIPATILSRCQRFDFRRIPTSMLVKHLVNIATQEKMELSETVIYSIAREADGSMRDAQSLLEQLLAFSGDGMDDTEILDILGVVDRQSVHKVGHAILTGDVRACLEAVEDLYRRGTDSKRFCRQLCDHFRNLLFFSMEGTQEGGGALWIDLPEEERGALRDEAKLTSPESLHIYFQMVIKGEDEIRRSSMPRVALEMMLLRMTQLPRLESLDKLLHKLSLLDGVQVAAPERQNRESRSARADAPPLPSRPRPLPPPVDTRVPPREEPLVHQNNGERNSGENAPPPSPFAGEPHPESDGGSPPPPLADAATPADLDRQWPGFIRWLQDKHPVLAAKLARSTVAVGTHGGPELQVMEVYEDTLKAPAALEKLQKAGETYFGRVFRWSIKARTSEKATAAETRKADGQGGGKAGPKRMVLEHPMVQAAIEILGGELVDIKQLKSGRGNQKTSS